MELFGAPRCFPGIFFRFEMGSPTGRTQVPGDLFGSEWARLGSQCELPGSPVDGHREARIGGPETSKFAFGGRTGGEMRFEMHLTLGPQ